MVEYLGIKSVLDVGCGRGISTSWFVMHGLEFVQCVEGSHDAVTQSIIPNAEDVVVEHDFSRGPWWPERTVDAVWCVEFTEHVGRNYQLNYYTSFRKAAFIFMTHSNWGGWHHVEVHGDDWWRVRMESMGFVYLEKLTQQMRALARTDSTRVDLVAEMEEKDKDGKKKYFAVAQHLWTTLMVSLFVIDIYCYRLKNNDFRMCFLFLAINHVGFCKSSGSLFARACSFDG